MCLGALCLLYPLGTSAYSGMADRFNAYRQWIMSAYEDFFILVLVSLVLCMFLYHIGKLTIYPILCDWCAGLEMRPELKVIVTSLLLSIPVGLVFSVMWLLFWLYGILPVGIVMVCFPIIVGLSPILRWTISKRILGILLLVTFGVALGSVLFVIATHLKLTMNYDSVYYIREFGGTGFLKFETHPYSSLRDIWTFPFIVACESPISLGVYWISAFIKKVKNSRQSHKSIFL